ncbi:interleukin-10 receptor subunit alpha [Gadus chalcogrammus]|uniref:interleukin-10 receptor subunit alpha n=1 Tax=Gadus chalcogrammus TaxID=1042646 RepID=UPI0024C4886D|nr:interleukin-10 receptor subunit alpha [Gadus chalcogrammus]
MDQLRTLWVLLFTTVCSNSVSSASPRRPDHLRASRWDGEQTVVWDPPSDVTPLARYSVQMSKHKEEWRGVSNCTLIQAPLCELTWLIDDFMEPYRVRVQTVTANGVSEWAVLRKLLPNDSNLRPPSFTLRASSHSLSVTVDDKPLLRKISLFGMTYTMFLEERGRPNETSMAYLNDDTEGPEGRSHTFRALYWGRDYCVRLQVAGNTGLQRSDVSAPQCVRLPVPEWYYYAVPSLSVLAVLAGLAVIMVALCSFLRHPEKTPLALEPPEKSWSPLRVGEGPMEVVTDKGWLLCMPKTPLEGWGGPGPRSLEAFRPETDWKSESRTSMDSGVSVSSNGATKTGGSDAVRQEDSGWVSSGGSRGAGAPPPRVWRIHARPEEETEAPAASGPGPQRRGSGSSEGPDGGSGQSGPAPDPYRHQAGPGPQGGRAALKEAAPTGYQRGQTPAQPPGYQPAFHTNYRRKTHIMMETLVSVEDSDLSSERTRTVLDDASPTLFLPLTFLPSVRGGLAHISLGDVELWGE